MKMLKFKSATFAKNTEYIQFIIKMKMIKFINENLQEKNKNASRFAVWTAFKMLNRKKKTIN